LLLLFLYPSHPPNTLAILSQKSSAQAQKPVQIVSLQNTAENTNFTEPINSNDYETTDEFRRFQEESDRIPNG
jgi:hypothetical protein